MNISLINNEMLLSFVIRVILGILFFYQGYDKIFKVKIIGVIEFFRHKLGKIQVPEFILTSSAYFTSYTEFLCGGLLILGLFKQYALLLLSVDLILVTGAFSLIKPMWDMHLLFPRLLLLAILLYLPAEWDVISVDYLMFKFFNF